MRRDVKVESNWRALIALCTTEREYQQDGSHPKLLRLVRDEIEQLAAEMGFSRRQIDTREFRAEKSGAHIVRIITE